MQASYGDMARRVQADYGVVLETTGAIGFSGMMHGYITHDKNGNLLVPFRTWRNNITGQASEALTALFDYPIPQRWSVAHLYQAILNGEDHVAQIDYLTTLAGYVHWKLTGRRVMGIGEASGMFPIDLHTHSFNTKFADQFDTLVQDKGFAWKLLDILPEVLVSGDNAGYLTEGGAKLLDVTGHLKPGIPFCAPEGDAGTGMVATNSVAVRTGNVSWHFGFRHDRPRKRPVQGLSGIDLVTTPDAAWLRWSTPTTAHPTTMPGSAYSANDS